MLSPSRTPRGEEDIHLSYAPVHVRIPEAWRNVWLLAAVSLLNDVSSEMLLAVLPFLLISQGATGLGLGLVGGVTEAVGHLFKLVGGYMGQRPGGKKWLIGTGYGVSTLSRFGVALTTAWPLTLAFRSVDRVGKGLRTAPRDAILADSIPKKQRGAAFGVHRAADTTGAVVGVLIVLGLLVFLDWSSARIVLAGACLGVLALIPLFFVKEPKGLSAGVDNREREPMSPHYGTFLAISATFHLARVSYLFYLVRAAQAGGGVVGAVLWYLLFNVVYAGAAYPLGRLSDGWGKMPLLLTGYGATALAALCFIPQPTHVLMAVGFVVLGVSFAAVEGTGRALASDLGGSRSRSARLGEYHAVTGVATLLGGIAAGLLWDEIGRSAAFAWGFILPALGAGALVWLMLRIGRAQGGMPPTV